MQQELLLRMNLPMRFILEIMLNRISDDEFFYELSATAMEHFVFKTIKDYLQYLPTYFNDTQKSFAVNGTIEEFALGIWNIYQNDRFGPGIIVKEWELMDQMRAMDAINKAIQIYGSTFAAELNNFAIWMYYTNYRTIPGQYFEDARFYPLVKPLSRLNYNPGSTIQLTAGPSSNSFVTIINPAVNDTLVTIITNSDVQNANNNTHSSYPFSFILYDHPVNNAAKINNNYFIEFSTSNSIYWTTSEILNNSIVRSGQSLAGQLSSPFPSPFNYSKNTFLYIPADLGNNVNVQFNIYSIAMELIFSSFQKLSLYLDQNVIKWNGRNENNEKLSSGVYIYTIKSGDTKIIGKFAIIN